MSSIKKTLYLSIIVQCISLVLGLYAQMYRDNASNDDNDVLLHDIMSLENIVQVIEFTFYLSVSYMVTNFIKTDIAKYRYYDWVFTTPVMLLTTILYFIHDSKCDVSTKIKKIKNIISNEWKTLIKIFLSNLGMLLVGYFQEIGSISLLTSTIIGFFCLDYSFYNVYQYVGSIESKYLFWIMYIIWSLYGFAAMYPNALKNSMYNILDIIAKNFYGIFIAYKIIF